MALLNCTAEADSLCAASCFCQVPPVQAPEPKDYQANVAIAFLVVTAAGLSTTIGAALVFCNRCVTRTNHKILGASLGFSSGVMLYVSFVEILQKSLDSFTSCDCLWDTQEEPDAAYTAASLCFFGGVVIVYLLDWTVHSLSSQSGHGHSHGPEALLHHGHGHEHSHGPEENAADPKRAQRSGNSPESKEERCCSNQNCSSGCQKSSAAVADREHIRPLKSSTTVPRISMPSSMDEFALEDESSGEFELHQAMSDPDEFLEKTLSRNVVEGDRSTHHHEAEGVFAFDKQMSRRMQEDDVEAAAGVRNPLQVNSAETEVLNANDTLVTRKAQEAESSKLSHMGLMTALAIGLHNFPEGLATFVATLDNPEVGGALAIAIAIHNIPEGLCVSVPIYYATGNRWKGFWVATFSGVTELIGAAIGYGFLMSVMGPAAYAILFGLVAGMMVTIVVKELLPTAHRYDPHDKVVTICIFVGMVVMALSLVLFRL